MCIRSEEIVRDVSTSSALGWVLFFVNAVIISSEPDPAVKSSFRVNPHLIS